MGLFRFIADMESYSKTSNKYGRGAGWLYLERRAEEDYQKEIINANRNAENYRIALEKVKADMKFDFTNHIRQKGELYSVEEKKYLDGIIKQIDNISNQENVDSLVKEFYDFTFKKIYPYEMAQCINDNKEDMTELLKKFNKNMTEEQIVNVSESLDKLTKTLDYNELTNEYTRFIKWAKKNIKKYYTIFEPIIIRDIDLRSEYFQQQLNPIKNGYK